MCVLLFVGFDVVDDVYDTRPLFNHNSLIKVPVLFPSHRFDWIDDVGIRIRRPLAATLLFDKGLELVNVEYTYHANIAEVT